MELVADGRVTGRHSSIAYPGHSHLNAKEFGLVAGLTSKGGAADRR